jgi:Bifunctional DNA primase/polymerase, N-terminal
MAKSKKPGLNSFKRYQTERPTDEDIRSWFGAEKIYGLGVMCGRVSGGLYCRDFDTVEAYDLWKANHPALAVTLPTVMTSRGYHVYGRALEKIKTEEFEDGELRGERAFVVQPPSRHPSGITYQWMNPLPAGELPLICPIEAGLSMLLSGPKRIESTEENRDTEAIASVRSVLSVTSVEDAIRISLPTHPGQRHRQVFKLARALKGIPELADVKIIELKPFVRRWHEAARPFISTQGFDETWSDFVNGWPNVKCALGESTMDQIIERLQMLRPPPEAAGYDTTEVKLLVGLCAELQRQAGGKPFYLDARTAASRLNVEAMTAWRWLKMFKTDGLLAEVETGRPGRATRWRWLGK